MTIPDVAASAAKNIIRTIGKMDNAASVDIPDANTPKVGSTTIQHSIAVKSAVSGLLMSGMIFYMKIFIASLVEIVQPSSSTLFHR